MLIKIYIYALSHKNNNHNNNNEKQDFALSTRTEKCKTKKKLYHFPSRWTQRKKKEIKQPTEKKIKIKKPRMRQYDLYRCLDCIT